MKALYGSLTVLTVLREANQVGHLQPTVLVSYEAVIEEVLTVGTRPPFERDGHGRAGRRHPARDQMKAGGEVRTQTFALLIAKGYRALLVRSLAAGVTESDFNLVLWEWGNAAPVRLVLIDDEGRLSR